MLHANARMQVDLLFAALLILAAMALALYAAGFLIGRRGRTLSEAASVATLVGGLAMRLAMQYAGKASATDPRISLRFAQPENLPRVQS